MHLTERDDALDQRLDLIPVPDLANMIKRKLDEIQPSIVFTHSCGDINRDHRIMSEIVLVATRPPSSVKEIYSFDITGDWAFAQLGSFHPNVFIDITETMEAKLKDLQLYDKIELREYPHPRSLEKITALAERWGSVISVRYAEAFELIRAIK